MSSGPYAQSDPLTASHNPGPKSLTGHVGTAYSSNMTDAMSLEVTAAAMEPLVVLQAVADPIRWTVLATLAQAPRCVCKLQEQVPIAGNLLSYHLKVLREAGLVTSSRRGRWIDYALADDAAERMRAALPGASVSVSA